MADLGSAADLDIGKLLEGATTDVYKLYVTRIPIEVNREGLLNIFGKCGQVIDATIPVGRNISQPYKQGFVTYATQEEAQAAVESVHNRPPFFMLVNHALSNEERAKKRIEENQQLQNGAEFADKLDDFHKTKGKGDAEISDKQKRLAEAALNHAIPKIVKGSKGLPANHISKLNMSGFSSGDEDEWIQIQGFIKTSKVTKHDFDRRPFTFNFPLVLPYAPMEVCSYCGKDGRLRCSRCRDWYCSEVCQKNHWPQHKFKCEPAPPLEKADGTVYRAPSRSLRQPVMNDSGISLTKDTTKEVLILTSNKSDEIPKAELDETNKKSEVKSDAKTELKKSVDVKPTEVKLTEVKPTEVKPNEVKPNEVKPTEVKQTEVKPKEVKTEVKPTEVKPKEVKTEVKPTEVMKVEADKKPLSPSKTVTFDNHKKSILQRFKSGDLLDLGTEVVNNDASRLSGMILDDKDFEYLSNDMKNEVQKITNFKKGDIVILKDQEVFVRAFVTEVTDKEVLALDIDWPKSYKLPKNEVYGLPAKAKNIEAAGIVAFGQGPIPKALTKLLEGVIQREGLIQAKVNSVIKKADGTFQSLDVTFYETKDKPLMNFILHPWHKFNPEVRTLLGLPQNTTMLKDLNQKRLQVSDEVVFVSFHSSNQLVVWMVKDVAHEENLSKELEVEGPKQAEVKNPAKGELVVCQWSEDDGYYRAVISEINVNDKKAKVRFVDYGNQSVEVFSRIREFPDCLLKYPIMAKLLSLHGVPEHSLKDVGVDNRLKQLEPLFQSPMIIAEEKSEKNKTQFIVEHANGKTINDIIKNKLKEESDTIVPPTIQGAEIDGQFNYDKAHICELKTEKGLEQEVYVMHADSPARIFVCPANQIGLAEKLPHQITNFAQLDEKMTGYGPNIGKLCLAKSNEDGTWYRGACLAQEGEEFRIFFVDWGFEEILPRANLKILDPVLLETPFLANHCVLEGFDDATKIDEYDKQFGALVEEKLPSMSDIKIKVVKKQGDYYVVQIPELKDLKPKSGTKPKPSEEKPKSTAGNSGTEPKTTESESEKEEKIRKLREELAKLGAV